MSVRLGRGSRPSFSAETHELIQASIRCAVELLEAAEQIRVLRATITERNTRADLRFADLQELGRELSDALSRKAAAIDSDLVDLTERIIQGANEEVARETRRVRDGRDRDVDDASEEIDELERTWRQNVEAFLRHHDLPGSNGKLSIVLTDKDRYEARLKIRNDAALGATFQLNISSDDDLALPLRVCDVVDRLKVHVPHRGRLLRRDGVARRKLDGLWVTCMVHTGSGTLIRLRKNPDDSVGFDLRFVYDTSAVTVNATGDDASGLPDHRAEDDDAEALREFERDLLAMVVPLSRKRAKGAKVSLADVPLADVESPGAVAKKIIHAIALLVGDASDQLTTEALRELIARLPLSAQVLFHPLGLAQPQRTQPPTPPPEALKKRRALSEIDRGWDRPNTAPPN